MEDKDNVLQPTAEDVPERVKREIIEQEPDYLEKCAKQYDPDDCGCSWQSMYCLMRCRT